MALARMTIRLPTTKAEREAYAEVVGADGWALLTDLYASDAPAWLREVRAVETLRRVWVQQYISVARVGQIRIMVSARDAPSRYHRMAICRLTLR